MGRSTVSEVLPSAGAKGILPGAQFADAYRLDITEPSLDARHAAERIIGRAPGWIDSLLTIRNLIVAPFGLHTGAPPVSSPSDVLGILPVVSETPERLVAGFDDKHLDFRVIVDIAGPTAARNVTLTTVVLTHNLLGRAYLAAILPFHRIIARTMLQQVVTP